MYLIFLLFTAEQCAESRDWEAGAVNPGEGRRNDPEVLYFRRLQR